MGACSSNETKVNDANKDGSAGIDDADFDSLPFERLLNPKNSRIKTDYSEDVKTLAISGTQYNYKISYGYVCQKGYYPNQLGKANQDSYMILNSMMGDNSCHVFGVFDGHGDVGDFCSHYAAEQFSTCLAKELRAAGGTKALTVDSLSVNKLYTQAFLKTNKLLKGSAIDDSLSGTTAITVLLKGEKLIIGNVGDSRAIIASDIDGKLKYSPLSSDQTPFRKDERERLKLRGAQIFTIDQIEGHEHIHENWGDGENGDEIDDQAADPPRVWDKTLEKPGCAFTRSIGDSVAETIGVFAEPEILSWDLQPNDRFAVIASDGVFEFLPNQTVVDMIAEYPDLIEGCKHVANQAYELWLQNDQRTDDITIIVLKFDDMREKDGSLVGATKISPRRDQISEKEQARPVRRVMNKARRKDISENWDKSDDIEFDFAANTTKKTPEELERVSNMVKTNFMFQHLTPTQREQIFSVMSLKRVSADEMIIKEGDNGDEMYIIDEGEFSVLKKNEEGISQIVFTYTTTGAAFGELSLMYGKPRAASIKAKTDGQLWCLGRQAFRAVLVKKNQQEILNLYKCVPVMKSVGMPKLHRLCERCTIEEFNNGVLVRENSHPLQDDNDDEGGEDTNAPKVDWVIGVVVSGALVVSNIASDGDSKSPRKHTREEGSYICVSELGLTIDKIHAEGRAKVAFLSAANFKDLLGSELLDELNRSISVPNHKGKPIRRKFSFFSDPKNINCEKSELTRDAISMEVATLLVGDYALVGTFNTTNQNQETYSAKMIFKKQACDSRMDARLLFERQILTALNGKCHSISKVIDCFQDEKIVMVNYADVYLCDLGLAIHQDAINEDHKIIYSACLCSAMFALHDLGIMHRFLNPGSVYINSRGLPKIADLRYAKKMNGQKAYTICGDPLYFAPEMVKQQGYDYGADLWALGTVIYELYEGNAVMGTHETEETQLFKKINAFEADSLEYTKHVHKKVRSVIANLMDPVCNRRCGYKTQDDLKQKKVFSKVDWANIGKDEDFRFELLSQADETLLPVEENMDCHKSESFDLF